MQVLGQSEATELQSVRAEGDPLCMQHRLGVMVRPLMHQPASTSDADCHTILGLIFDSGLIVLFLSTQSSLVSSRSVLIQATAKKNDLIIYHRDRPSARIALSHHYHTARTVTGCPFFRHASIPFALIEMATSAGILQH